jgi:hypothetical protein
MADKQFEQTPYSPDRFTLVELERELGSSELPFFFFFFFSSFLVPTDKPIPFFTRFRPSQGSYSDAVGHEEAGPRWQGCPGQLCLQDPPVKRFSSSLARKTRSKSFLFLFSSRS